MLVDSYLMYARRNSQDISNMSSVRLWFPCIETSGDIITDVVDGLEWSPLDERGVPQTNVTVVGDSADNTLTVSNWDNVIHDFDNAIVGETYKITGGTGSTALRGTYSIVSLDGVDPSNKAVVSEPVTSGTLTGCTIQRISPFGRMVYDTSLRTVYPEMPNVANSTTSLNSGSRRCSPTSFRKGTLPTIEAGKSFVFMYVARIMCVSSFSNGYESSLARCAFGDNNNILGGGNAGLGLAGGDFHTAFQDGSGNTLHTDRVDNQNLDSTYVDKDVLVYLKHTSGTGNEHKMLEWDGSTYTELLASDADTSSVGCPGGTCVMPEVAMGTSFNYFRSSALAYYGLALFTFDTMPSDIDEALKWMSNQWIAGNRVMYPGIVNWS